MQTIRSVLFVCITLRSVNCFLNFEVVYEWTHINFNSNSPWNDSKTKEQAKFVSENTVPIGIKIYEDKIFMALRKLSDAVPVTLAYFRKNNTNRRNIPLIPYPSWEDNFEQNCSYLQKAQSMEIDLDGVMWVIDGVRPKSNEKCPCKLVLLDLNNNGKNLHTYVFPEDICRKSGGFLNDIVLDDTDGGYAYITDSSSVDPGIIVYSKEQNKSWKLRDDTMYATNDAPIFKIDEQYITSKGNVNGIALSPKKGFNIKGRILYYSDGSDYNLYSISTDILRNETLCNTAMWKKGINLVGKKQGSTGGMICDNGGDLFYTLQSLNAIGKWNIYRPFNTSQVIFKDNKTLIWPDSFSMDNIERDVYILSNHIPSFSNPAVHLGFNDVKFRLLKYHNGKKSYICTGPQVKVQCSNLCEGRKFWFCN